MRYIRKRSFVLACTRYRVRLLEYYDVHNFTFTLVIMEPAIFTLNLQARASLFIDVFDSLNPVEIYERRSVSNKLAIDSVELCEASTDK